MDDKLAYSIPSFCKAVDIGRSKICEEIKAGCLRTFKVGQRTLIIPGDGRAWLQTYLEKGPAECSNEETASPRARGPVMIGKIALDECLDESRVGANE